MRQLPVNMMDLELAMEHDADASLIEPQTPYFDVETGSIGRWKKAINHDPAILHPWREFEAQATHRRAIEFLREHGIEPVEGQSS